MGATERLAIQNRKDDLCIDRPIDVRRRKGRYTERFEPLRLERVCLAIYW